LPPTFFLKDSEELIHLLLSGGAIDYFLYGDKGEAMALMALMALMAFKETIMLTLWKDSPIQIDAHIQ